MILLEVRNLVVRYGGVTAVRDLSFDVREGEIVCFVGQNGAGKSTTAHAISGVVIPAEGDIRFLGQSVKGKNPEAIVSLGIGLIPEGRRIFSRMTVRENLAAASGMRGGLRASKDLLDRVLTLFPILAERINGIAGQLSGGEQQQLAIARAMLTRPRLLIVDEPSLGLAPLVVDRVFETLRSLREEGTTLLVVEQSARRALTLADRVYLMRSGSLVMEGRSDDLRGNDAFEAGYFGTGKAT
jgi:branched-chain amino acid transport system ATP-binding protein